FVTALKAESHPSPRRAGCDSAAAKVLLFLKQQLAVLDGPERCDDENLGRHEEQDHTEDLVSAEHHEEPEHRDNQCEQREKHVTEDEQGVRMLFETSELFFHG